MPARSASRTADGEGVWPGCNCRGCPDTAWICSTAAARVTGRGADRTSAALVRRRGRAALTGSIRVTRRGVGGWLDTVAGAAQVSFAYTTRAAAHAGPTKASELAWAKRRDSGSNGRLSRSPPAMRPAPHAYVKRTSSGFSTSRSGSKVKIAPGKFDRNGDGGNEPAIGA